MSTNVLYKDHTVQIGDCYLTIFKYYFPLATSKTILFSDIERVSLEDGYGAAQKWGICTKYLNNWFPYDNSRKNKTKFIAIHLKGKKIMPSFTPEDPQKVFNLIYENFTQEGKRVVQYRLSQCGKQTQMAQQQLMDRMKEEEDEKTTQNLKQKIVEKNVDSPSKRKIVKVEIIENLQEC